MRGLCDSPSCEIRRVIVCNMACRKVEISVDSLKILVGSMLDYARASTSAGSPASAMACVDNMCEMLSLKSDCSKLQHIPTGTYCLLTAQSEERVGRIESKLNGAAAHEDSSAGMGGRKRHLSRAERKQLKIAKKNTSNGEEGPSSLLEGEENRDVDEETVLSGDKGLVSSGMDISVEGDVYNLLSFDTL